MIPFITAITIALSLTLIDIPFAAGFVKPKSADFLLQVDGGSIASGVHHICAIEQRPGEEIGGRVKCWGYDDDTGVVDRAPTDITFVQIASGYDFVCGVSVEQTLHCWGRIQGQIPGLFTQVSIEGRSYFGCGVMTDGSIECFGGSRFHHLTPKHADRRYLQVSCGGSHCCAIDSQGYPHCWAEHESNAHLRLPTITYKEFVESQKRDGWIVPAEKEEDFYEEENEAEEEEVSVDGTPRDSDESLVQFRQISVSDDMSCGITLVGAHILCWGPSMRLKRGQIPRQIKGPFRQVSLGGRGFCAITGDAAEMSALATEDDEAGASSSGTESSADQLQCWGPAQMAVDMNYFPAWDQISMGVSFICGVSMESEMYCEGNALPKPYSEMYRDVVIA